MILKKDTEKVLEAIKADLELEMVLCPKGQFKMSNMDKSSLSSLIKEGYTDQDSWYPTEFFKSGISGQVKIEIPFLIGKYPVTQKQYELITGKNPSKFKGENNPVDSVSKKEACEFCNILNEKYKNLLGEIYEFCLPLETQWEYASKNAKDILGIGKFSEYVLGRHRYHYHTNLTVKRGKKGGIKTCPATNDSESLILGYEHINPTPGVLRLGIVPEG